MSSFEYNRQVMERHPRALFMLGYRMVWEVKALTSEAGAEAGGHLVERLPRSGF